MPPLHRARNPSNETAVDVPSDLGPGGLRRFCNQAVNGFREIFRRVTRLEKAAGFDKTQLPQPQKFKVNARAVYAGNGKINFYVCEAILQDGKLTIMPEKLDKIIDVNSIVNASGAGGVGTGSGATTTLQLIISPSGWPISGT